MVNGISNALTALKVFQKKMGNSANNVANLNTKGYKKSQSSLQDVSPENISTASGVSQVGRGTNLQDIAEVFSQGSLEPTSSPTDMAIGGDGFFIVRAPEGGDYYTRDGHFYFDKEGRLVNASGHVAQGWEADPVSGDIRGSIKDIEISSLTSPPKETTITKNIVNLNANAGDNTVGTNALASVWDGDNPDGKPMADSAYDYQTSTKVYDGTGAAHDIGFYFDKAGSGSEWEFIVTTPPNEDRRAGAAGDNLGLLARGTLAFNDSGTISDMTLDNNDGGGNWSSQNISSDLTAGHFTFHPDFLGATDGSSEMSIQLDFGASHNGSLWVNDPFSSTQYAASSNTVYSSADGYGSGHLESAAISGKGVISGSYSNGQVLNLYQLALAKFNNSEGLKKTGGNLYAETTDSGNAMTGRPGINGLGRIAPNALEQSNVDLGEEFVNIILTQHGFQANLKVVSAEDEMIGSLLNIIS